MLVFVVLELRIHLVGLCHQLNLSTRKFADDRMSSGLLTLEFGTSESCVCRQHYAKQIDEMPPIHQGNKELVKNKAQHYTYHSFPSCGSFACSLPEYASASHLAVSRTLLLSKMAWCTFVVRSNQVDYGAREVVECSAL